MNKLFDGKVRKLRQSQHFNEASKILLIKTNEPSNKVLVNQESNPFDSVGALSAGNLTSTLQPPTRRTKGARLNSENVIPSDTASHMFKKLNDENTSLDVLTRLNKVGRKHNNTSGIRVAPPPAPVAPPTAPANLGINKNKRKREGPDAYPVPAKRVHRIRPIQRQRRNNRRPQPYYARPEHPRRPRDVRPARRPRDARPVRAPVREPVVPAPAPANLGIVKNNKRKREGPDAHPFPAKHHVMMRPRRVA
jgi:hypothetical protein